LSSILAVEVEHLLIRHGAMPLSKREPIQLVSIALQHARLRGGTRGSLSWLPPMQFLLLLLNHPTLVRGNLCISWIGNPIIIIFLVLIYSSTMRGVVNHVSPQFCSTCVAVGLMLGLACAAYQQKEVANEVLGDGVLLV